MPGSFIFFKPLFSERDCFEHRRLIQQFVLKGLWVVPTVKAMACAKKQGCEYADSYNRASQYTLGVKTSDFKKRIYAVCVCLKNWLWIMAACSHLFLQILCRHQELCNSTFWVRDFMLHSSGLHFSRPPTTVWLCTGAVQLLLSFPKNLFLVEARITQWKSELRYLIWKLSGSITWLTEFVERRMELIQIFLSRSCDKLPQPHQLTEKRIYDRYFSSRGFCSIVAKWSHGSRSRKLRDHILKCKHKANWRWLESLNIPVSVTYFLLQGCTS